MRIRRLPKWLTIVSTGYVAMIGAVQAISFYYWLHPFSYSGLMITGMVATAVAHTVLAVVVPIWIMLWYASYRHKRG